MEIKGNKSELYINTALLEANAKNVKKACEQADKYFNDYYSALKNIKTYGLMEGKTAEAFSNYISKVELILNKAAPIGEQYYILIKSFLTDIDSADNFLYKGKGIKKLRDSDFEDAQNAVLHNNDFSIEIINWIVSKICQFISINQFTNAMNLTENAKKQLKEKTGNELNLIKSAVRTTDKSYANKFALLYDSISAYKSMIDILFDLVDPVKKDNFFSTAYDAEYGNFSEIISSNADLMKNNFYVTDSSVYDFSKTNGKDYFDNIDAILKQFYDEQKAKKIITSKSEQYYLLKNALKEELNKFSKDYSESRSTTEAYKKNFDNILNTISEFGDQWDKHIAIPDEQKEAMNSLLNLIGGAKKISSLADDVIDSLYQLFFSMAESKKMLNAFLSNYDNSDPTVNAAITQLKDLYNKKSYAIANEITEKIINREKNAIKGLCPSKYISSILSAIDFKQNADNVKERRNAVEYYDFVKASQQAYINSINKLKGIGKNNPNYKQYVYNAKVCFQIAKNAKLKMLKYMIASSKDKSKKEYYQYCYNQLKHADMSDDFEIESDSAYDGYNPFIAATN